MPGMRNRLKVLFITAWYPNREHPVAGVFVREHAKAVRLHDNVCVLQCDGIQLRTVYGSSIPK